MGGDRGRRDRRNRCSCRLGRRARVVRWLHSGKQRRARRRCRGADWPRGVASARTGWVQPRSCPGAAMPMSMVWERQQISLGWCSPGGRRRSRICAGPKVNASRAANLASMTTVPKKVKPLSWMPGQRRSRSPPSTDLWQVLVMADRRGRNKAPVDLRDGVAVRWRPPAVELEALSALLAPWRALTDPVFFGLEHVPDDGPVVLVGNHSIFGMLASPLLC